MSAMLNPEPAVALATARTADRSSFTQLLTDLRAGRREAFDQILPIVYHELRRSGLLFEALGAGMSPTSGLSMCLPAHR